MRYRDTPSQRTGQNSTFHLTFILRNILLNNYQKEKPLKQDNRDHLYNPLLAPGMNAGKWALTLYAMVIPLLGITILIVWAIRFRRNSPPK